MITRFTVRNFESLNEPAEYIVSKLKKTPIALFYGEMGAGKTTLIQKICTLLGVIDHVSSPTFSIVNEYIYNEKKLFHFDLYRIIDEEELWNLGFQEYIDTGGICLIEWPGISETFLIGFQVLIINIENLGNERSISIEIKQL